MKNNFENLVSIIERWAGLGTRKLENGTYLVGHVPHVGPQAYLHIIFPPLDPEQITGIEQKIGTVLPDEYREFLLRVNGLHVFSTALAIYGMRRNYVRVGDEAIQPFDINIPNTIERPKDADEAWVIIGSYKQDGSNIYIDKTTGKVYRSERWKAKNRLNEWPDFWTMLTSEVQRLSTLFDELGRKIDQDAPTTP